MTKDEAYQMRIEAAARAIRTVQTDRELTLDTPHEYLSTSLILAKAAIDAADKANPIINDPDLNYAGCMADLDDFVGAVAGAIKSEVNLNWLLNYVQRNYPKEAMKYGLTSPSMSDDPRYIITWKENFLLKLRILFGAKICRFTRYDGDTNIETKGWRDCKNGVYYITHMGFRND